MTRVDRERDVLPAALGAVLAGAAPWSRWPLRVGPETPAASLDGLLESAAAGTEILAQHLPRIARAFHEATATRAPRPVGEVAAEAAARLREELELSDAGRRALDAEFEGFASRLGDGALVGLGPEALRTLHARAVASSRRARVAAVATRARDLASRLEEKLRVDEAHGPAAAAPGAVARALGEASDRVDADALARRVAGLRGPVRLGAERRARLEALARALRRGAAALESAPDVRSVEGERALTGAGLAFDEAAGEALELFRAVRAARLEAEDAFDPRRHEPALSRLSWRSLDAGEIGALPRIAVEVDVAVLSEELAAFSALLRSGRPVHVLVARAALPSPWEDGAAPLDPAHLAMAHRDVLVLQATLARPAHLALGLARLSESALPAVAAVAAPGWGGADRDWVELLAADAGRVAPTFLYDPAAGTHWAHRFESGDDPQPERAWPRFGDDEAFTYADAAALAPAWAESFRAVGRDAWSEIQLPIVDWLDAEPERRSETIPYVRVVGPDGAIDRLEVRPDLALACLERGGAWRAVRELAGTDDEYARRSATAAREAALAQAGLEIAALRAAHAAEVDRVRRETAGEAIDRVVGVLLGTAEPFGSPNPPAAARTVAGAPAEPAAPVETAEDAPEPLDAEPYVISMLCTSCQDCININPRLFRYDGNKQAYIADVAAGTFDELVRAAEKCPARCIRTGEPRPGDPTVTDALIARAAKFR